MDPLASASADWFGTWSRPPDRPSEVALGLGALLVVLAVVPHAPRWVASFLDLPSIVDLRRRRRFLMLASFVAAFLSLGYIAFYLRGGPRAHEAAGYWIEGRALSRGFWSWPVVDPSASFRARDLAFRLPDRVSSALPPGFPLLLAMGFLVGAPMLVGPMLAAALVVATWFFAHELVAGGAVGQDARAIAERTGSVRPASFRAEAIARVAAALSVVSAALRYHTAEALPHAAAALAVVTVLGCSLRAHRTGDARLFGAAGLALGFLVATRPPASLAVGAAALALSLSRAPRSRGPTWLVLATLPGALALLSARHAVTGHWLASGAFGGAPALSELAQGAAGPGTIRGVVRVLREHLVAIANLEIIALVALVPVLAAVRRPAVGITALVIVGHVGLSFALHATGAGPGALPGALVAVLPLEHALLAAGLARLFPMAFGPAAIAALGLSLVGFAVHASHLHATLAASPPGRPRYEPDALREANVTHGLVFFDDDDGYELASQPGVAASHGVEAVRRRGDDNDRLLYDALGHPSTHRYVVPDVGDAGDAADAAPSSVIPWTPPGGPSDTWRFEAESEWPPVSQDGAVVDAVSVPNSCVSAGKVLRVVPMGAAEARVTFALPAPPASGVGERRTWTVAPRIYEERGGGSAVLTLRVDPSQPPVAEWRWTPPPGGPDAGGPAWTRNPSGSCVDLSPQSIELGADRPRAWFELRASGAAVMLDRTTLRPR